MKRMISFVSALCLLLTICGCRQIQQPAKEPVNYYYRNGEVVYGDASGVITCEQRESFGHTGDYEYLITEYFKGPVTENCVSPFPAGITVEKLELVNDSVRIIVSSHLASLTTAEQSVACVCLGKTLLELTGVKSVQIGILNNQINGKDYIIINESSYLLVDPDINESGS